MMIICSQHYSKTQTLSEIEHYTAYKLTTPTQPIYQKYIHQIRMHHDHNCPPHMSRSQLCRRLKSLQHKTYDPWTPIKLMYQKELDQIHIYHDDQCPTLA